MAFASEALSKVTLPARLPRGFGLGDYIVDGWLRDGGMAAIYRAHRSADGSRVALKVQFPSTVHLPSICDRFDREAHAMRKISGGSNVVEVFDTGILEDGRRYFVMEWIDGEDLEEQLDFLRNDDRRLPIPDACQIGYAIATGLQVIHDHGFVHRDLKPANVMLGREGDPPVIKLVDFGIVASIAAPEVAPLVGGGGGVDEDDEEVMGTSAYMAPEQAAGATPQPTMDIFALGVVLYEALTGTCVPPDGWTPESLPTIDSHRRGVPEGLVALVRACMSSEIGQRPQQAGEVAQGLARFVPGLADAADGVDCAGAESVPEADAYGEAAGASVAAERSDALDGSPIDWAIRAFSVHEVLPRELVRPSVEEQESGGGSERGEEIKGEDAIARDGQPAPSDEDVEAPAGDAANNPSADLGPVRTGETVLMPRSEVPGFAPTPVQTGHTELVVLESADSSNETGAAGEASTNSEATRTGRTETAFIPPAGEQPSNDVTAAQRSSGSDNATRTGKTETAFVPPTGVLPASEAETAKASPGEDEATRNEKTEQTDTAFIPPLVRQSKEQSEGTPPEGERIVDSDEPARDAGRESSASAEVSSSVSEQTRRPGSEPNSLAGMLTVEQPEPQSLAGVPPRPSATREPSLNGPVEHFSSGFHGRESSQVEPLPQGPNTQNSSYVGPLPQEPSTQNSSYVGPLPIEPSPRSSSYVGPLPPGPDAQSTSGVKWPANSPHTPRRGPQVMTVPVAPVDTGISSADHFPVLPPARSEDYAVDDDVDDWDVEGPRRSRWWWVALLIPILAVGVWLGLSSVDGGTDDTASTEVASGPARLIKPSAELDAVVAAASPAESHRDVDQSLSPAANDESVVEGREENPITSSTPTSKEKTACAKLRKKARSAKTARHYRLVLKNTSDRTCWSGSRKKLERMRLRVEAYTETENYDRCIKEGSGSSDSEIKRRVDICTKRLKHNKELVNPW